MVEPPCLPAPPGARRPPAPTRRAVVGGLVAVGGLTGCSGGSVRRAVGIGGSDSPAPLTPDVRVATRALTAVRGAREQLVATIARYPGLAGTLSPLVAVHRAHESSLVDAVPARARTEASPSVSPPASPSPTSTSSADTSSSGSPTPSGSPTSRTSAPTPTPTSSGAPAAPRVPRTRPRALSAAVAREERLHRTLDALALEADSGEFARLLASMGAAVAQRLTAVPT